MKHTRYPRPELVSIRMLARMMAVAVTGAAALGALSIHPAKPDADTLQNLFGLAKIDACLNRNPLLQNTAYQADAASIECTQADIPKAGARPSGADTFGMEEAGGPHDGKIVTVSMRDLPIGLRLINDAGITALVSANDGKPTNAAAWVTLKSNNKLISVDLDDRGNREIRADSDGHDKIGFAIVCAQDAHSRAAPITDCEEKRLNELPATVKADLKALANSASRLRQALLASYTPQ